MAAVLPPRGGVSGTEFQGQEFQGQEFQGQGVSGTKEFQGQTRSFRDRREFQGRSFREFQGQSFRFQGQTN
jgi:hypothetical protein